jgi:hypothetical protein
VGAGRRERRESKRVNGSMASKSAILRAQIAFSGAKRSIFKRSWARPWPFNGRAVSVFVSTKLILSLGDAIAVKIFSITEVGSEDIIPPILGGGGWRW